jgi:hypothetical protein
MFFFSLIAANLSGKYTFPKKKVLQKEDLPPGITPKEIDYQTLFGIYDATNQTTQLLDTDPVSRMPGLINDLDGGLSFWPKYYTSDNELVDIWRAEDMKEYLTEEYFTAHEIKDPIAHQKLKELVQKLDIDNNPVIVIGKLRPELIGDEN